MRPDPGAFAAGMRVLAVSGSLQRRSANSALLREVVRLSPDADVVVWDELGSLPHFSPDADANGAVESLRSSIGDADAVLIATPEYAGGMPGSLKNALDWLVGSGELYGKPVVVISAAPAAERGHNARRWVEEVLGMQGASVRDSFTVAVAPGSDDETIAGHAAAAWSRVRSILALPA